MITMKKTSRIASFVKDFFVVLNTKNLRAAVLHGGAEGFENELTDVDFAVDPETFILLSSLIDEHCTRSGWQLCQVLRHETSAACFICSAVDDPSCAVALDACSDYQRNGTLFLTAESLLKNRKTLPWGGYGLTPTTELCYRFAKAAAKGKDPSASAEEFASYPDEVRRDCTVWIETQWGIYPQSSDASDLAAALIKLREQSNLHPSLTQDGALGRIASRIFHPTGLILIIGHDDFEGIASRLENVFGHLYFRRIRKEECWRPAMLKDLIKSTLIIVPELGALWPKLIPANCIHRLDSTQDPDQQCKELGKHLHERCMSRETP